MLKYTDENHKQSDTVLISHEVLCSLRINLDDSRKATNDLRSKLKYRDHQVCCIKEKIKNVLSIEQYKTIKEELINVPGKRNSFFMKFNYSS